jgi:hypothetical protein
MTPLAAEQLRQEQAAFELNETKRRNGSDCVSA